MFIGRAVVSGVCLVGALLGGCGLAEQDPPAGSGGAASVGGGSGGDVVGTGTGSAPSGGTSGGGTGGGGVSTGGVSTGGIGGDAAAVVLPEGCELDDPGGNEDYCTARVTCDGAVQLPRCGRQGAGRWRCTCSPDDKREYEFKGGTALAACGLAGGVCAQNDSELGEEICEVRSGLSGSDDCSLQIACGRPLNLPFAPGKQGWLMDYAGGYCRRFADDEPFTCSCDNVTPALDLFSETAEPACAATADYCRGGVLPTFDGPETCRDFDGSTSETSCDVRRMCWRTEPLSEEVSVADVEDDYLSCHADEGSGVRCSCGTRRGSFTFDTEMPLTVEACWAELPICELGVEFEKTGAADCESLALDEPSPDECLGQLQCRQPAIAAGFEIVGHGELVTLCRREAANQPWWCSCVSGLESTVFQLGAAGASASAACSAAPSECLERMDLALGALNDFILPPDPLATP